MLLELLGHERDELRRDAVRIVVITVAAESFDGDHLQRCPAERRVHWLPVTGVLVRIPPGASNFERFARTRAACAFPAIPVQSG